MANIGSIAAHPRKWSAGPKTTAYGAKLRAFDVDSMTCFGVFPTSLSYISVMLRDLVGQETINPGYQKRTQREIRYITGDVDTPWVYVSPVFFDLNHLLAGIEGPPDTPYEGGVFWIDVRFPQGFPFEPPKLRFLTRVYPPNIDRRGYICLDLLDEQRGWGPKLRLFTVLVSICSLLDDPGLEDPLVPEIAEIYCKNYDLYCQNARTYTARYAMADPTDTVFHAEGWLG